MDNGLTMDDIIKSVMGVNERNYDIKRTPCSFPPKGNEGVKYPIPNKKSYIITRILPSGEITKKQVFLDNNEVKLISNLMLWMRSEGEKFSINEESDNLYKLTVLLSNNKTNKYQKSIEIELSENELMSFNEVINKLQLIKSNDIIIKLDKIKYDKL